ncbi:LytTR family DNA-binding domain-containing protein [Marinomonas sp. 15G1-11]|uniref:LytTR family DNA-binding domain-containing protein n=1 Tax=Marinomonas phaeophyticola TaxID=3004091 RepID=A0ABT4JX07_9GAMM|nr:LytTR family DNA-binding domain-containing protein [Marinomonas sp. 15G1-11]MCZ2722918.1 LytTR family DNA-binding domain-containing protein [Marinomonas sp. 15G1-11]
MNILVVDDEPLLRFHMQKMLNELWEDVDHIVTANSGIDALKLMEEIDIHTVFMDIKMPGMSGLEAAKAMRRQGYKGNLVFVTAYDEHAIEAFEQEAVDYLLKPVEESRLSACIERLIKQDKTLIKYELDAEQINRWLPADTTSVSYLSWINVSIGDRILVINVDDVFCFISEDKYTTVVTKEGEYLIKKSIKQLVTELHPDRFWRIHRAVIVQVAKISQVMKDEQGRYSLSLKEMNRLLPVSRNNTYLFKQM